MSNRIGIKGRVVDLYVRFVDSVGNPVNADNTPQVEIRDSEGTIRRALSNMGVGLAKAKTGLYLFSFNIPDVSPDGYYTDRWLAEIGNTEVENTFEFKVISAGEISKSVEPTFDPGDTVPWNFSEDESHGINVLLKTIKYRLKSSGTRKVREGNQYIDVPCSIFTDAELICFLVNSLSSFNQYPHFTKFTFADSQIYGMFADIIIQGGVLLALASQALIEKGREFSINDNGITYQPPMIADMLNAQYSTQLADYKEKLKNIKISIPPTPRGLGTFRVTAINPNFLRLRHLRERQIV